MSKSILMTGALAALLSLAWASESTADTTSTVALRSPDGKLSVRVGLMSEGRLSYTVADGLEALLAPSPLGLVVDGVDLGAGAKFAGEPAVSEINETYPAFYNHAVAANHAKEAVIPLETAGKKFNLIVRVYDDGVAVRYSLPDGAQGVDGDSTTWVLPANTGKIAWQEHSQCYEGFSHVTTLAEVPEGKSILGPLTVAVGNHYLSMSEADCETFSDMGFLRQGNTLKANFPFQSQWKIKRQSAETRPGVLNGTWHGLLVSPWRTTVVARNLTELVNSDLLTNLCPAPGAGEDFSWVKPGRALWQWWSVGAPRYEDQKNWFDAAAKLKWEYYLIDDGWRNWRQPGKDQWACLKDVIDYGKSVGVESLVWVDSKEMRQPAARRAYLEKVKATGAAGIKIDFIPDATADVMQWYAGGQRDCADLKLALNFHGSVKPTGLRRTFPCDITREAVRGDEYHMSRYHRVMPLAQDVSLPFTRPLAGPADVTPVMMDPAQLKSSHFTWPHELAQGLVFSAPVLHFADQYKFYVESPVVDLLQEYPTTWDETRVLGCTEMGEVVAYARRKGGTWWIGAMNGAMARDVRIPLDFLGKATHGTLVYDNLIKDAAVDRREQDVSPLDTLNVKLRPAGGFVARIGPSTTTGPVMSAPTSAVPADTNHQPWAHPRFVQQTKLAEQGGFDLMLLGDSITQGWEMWGKNAWIQKMAPKFTAGNFGIGADRTENVLWRLESGHLKGAINPKVVMLMIGTNNTDANEPQDIALGVQAIVNKLTARFPKAHVLLLGVFPRRDRNNAVVAEINRVLPRLDDGKQVHFMDIGDAFLKNGQPDPALYADHVHLNNAGYEKWADKVVPVIAQWMK